MSDSPDEYTTSSSLTSGVSSMSLSSHFPNLTTVAYLNLYQHPSFSFFSSSTMSSVQKMFFLWEFSDSSSFVGSLSLFEPSDISSFIVFDLLKVIVRSFLNMFLSNLVPYLLKLLDPKLLLLLLVVYYYLNPKLPLPLLNDESRGTPDVFCLNMPKDFWIGVSVLTGPFDCSVIMG